MSRRSIILSIVGAVAVIVAVGAILAMPSFSPLQQTGDSTTLVYPRETKIFGRTYEELSKDWWIWAGSIPQSDHPLNDPVGEKCGMKQSGPIWYLGGTFSGNAERTCEIPEGKAIFMPVINGICTYELDNPKNEKELHDCIVNYIDDVTEKRAIIDGSELSNIGDFRVLSEPFNMTVPADGLYGMSSVTTLTQADGYYIGIEPLSKGRHTIEISGALVNPVDTSYNFATKVKYNLIVE